MDTRALPTSFAASVEPPRDPNRRADIDGLRAIAILSVLGFHATPQLLPGGFCGVDVFYVISGYLITGIIVRDLGANRFSFIEFYARRARRLFPALLPLLVFVLIIGWLLLLPDEFRQLGKHVFAASGFSLNLVLYNDVGAYFYTHEQQLLHLWSLGIEEQFYLLWPLYVVLLWKLGARLRIAGILFLTLASFYANVTTVDWDPLASFYLPWNRLWQLSLGGALGYLQQRPFTRKTIRSRRAAFLVLQQVTGPQVRAFTGAATLLLAFVYMDRSLSFPGWWALIPSGATLLVLSSGPTNALSQYILSQPLPVMIGRISYPLYLWHWPLLSFAYVLDASSVELTIGAVVLSVVLAAVTYTYIEVPTQRSGKLYSTAVKLSVGMLACAAISLAVYTTRIPARPLSGEVAILARAAAEDWLPGTDSSWTPLVHGFLKVGNRPHYSLFIGDSFIQHYYPRIESLAPLAPQGAIFAVRGACSVLTTLSTTYGTRSCKHHIDQALRLAENPRVDTVVIGANWVGYLLVRKQGQLVLKPDAKPELDQLESILRELKKKSKRVFIVLQSPTGAQLNPRRMIVRTFFSPGFRATTAEPLLRSEVDRTVEQVNRILSTIARRTGALIVDPMNSLCDATYCQVVTSSGMPIYHDFGHLNPAFARGSATFIDQTLVRHDNGRLP